MGIVRVCNKFWEVYCGVSNKRWAVAESRIPSATRRGLASEELRRHNLTAVLGRLHLDSPMSRSQLATETGLNRSTIRDLIGELADLGLIVEERGVPKSGPGRPSSVARVAPEGAVVLAIELEVDSIAVATIGLGGHIFDEIRSPNDPLNTSAETVVSRLRALSKPLLERLPDQSALVGAGVGVAGVVRRSDGFIHVAPNLGWRAVPIGQMIAKGLEIDLVKVANEADLGALGEFRRGAGRGTSNLIYLAGEVGVGIGIIHESQPMLGASGYAGEAGHTMVNPGGRQCRCGSIGCWETEVGEEAIIRHAGLEGWSEGSAFDEIRRRAEAGEPMTLEALETVGGWLGSGIGNLINIFNPDTLVVGGFFQALYEYISRPIEVEAKRVALDAPWLGCSIVKSELGPNALLIGAAELVLGDVVADPTALIERLAPAG